MPDAPPQPAFVHSLLPARDWQDRPQLSQLCDWWKSAPAGICALVGIGGSGKTAIAERFLRLLPGGLPPLQNLAKRRNIAAAAKGFSKGAHLPAADRVLFPKTRSDPRAQTREARIRCPLQPSNTCYNARIR